MRTSRAANVEQIWTDDKKTLGEDLITDPTVTTVFPGQPGSPPVAVSVMVDGATKFIGIPRALPQGRCRGPLRMLVASPERRRESASSPAPSYAVTLVKFG